jgi:hypothetical protein
MEQEHASGPEPEPLPAAEAVKGAEKGEDMPSQAPVEMKEVSKEWEQGEAVW